MIDDEKEIEERRAAAATNIFEEAFGGFALESIRTQMGLHFRTTLDNKAVEYLFADASENKYLERMKRYILREMSEGRMHVTIVSDRKETAYAAGDLWAGYENADIRILADRDILGSGKIRRHGAKSVIRATFIHEVEHARIDKYLRRWLKKHGVAEAWARRLNTTTEEYMARHAEERALGHSGIIAKTRACIATMLDAGMLPRFWKTLEEAWRQKLHKEGVEVSSD